MKRRVALDVWRYINDYNSEYLPKKFSYFLAKNKKALKNEIDALQEAVKTSPEWLEYEQKRIQILVKYAEKDNNGEPIIRNNQYILNRELIFEATQEINDLVSEYKDVLDQREKEETELRKLLEEEVEIPGCAKIEVEFLPEKLKPEFVELLLEADLIED